MTLRIRMLLGFALICGLGTATGIALAGGHGGRGAHGKVCGSAPDDANGMVSFRAEAASACDCASATHHGAYVSCVARMAKLAVKTGALDKQCRGGVVRCARRSTCGKPGAVTCCRTHKNGVTKCSATMPEDCRAPRGGTATMGGGDDECAGAQCGNGHLDPGEQCDPPGSATCPSGSPGGAMVGSRAGAAECRSDCTCPGGTATTTIPSGATTTTICGPGMTTTTTMMCNTTTTTICNGMTTTTMPTGGTTTTMPAGGTTTTTSGGGTTTTMPGGGGQRLSFTTAVGAASCGNAGLTSPPPAPLSGMLDSDTGCSSKVADLGLGCLYFGGGNATVVAGGKIPDAATSFLDVSGSGTLAGSAGTGSQNCTLGAGPGKHCANNNSLPSCTADGDCGGAPGSCALDANCYFGPPLPIVSPAPFASLTTCVLNVVQTTASGTVDPSSGSSSVSLPLSSRVYITGNSASPCPKCVSGQCDASWKTATNTTSPDTGKSCTAVGAQGTTIECRPSLPGFQAPLPVDLTPLTSGTATKTAADGLFCQGQTTAGAFGQAGAKCITETGTPAGNLSDGQPHPAVLGSVFCIPATGNGAVDGVADLPGPGAIGLNGTAQLQ